MKEREKERGEGEAFNVRNNRNDQQQLKCIRLQKYPFLRYDLTFQREKTEGRKDSLERETFSVRVVRVT